jgi:transposase-like protein
LILSTPSDKSLRRKFAPEFREQAVKRVLSSHAVSVVAHELDIGESLLHNWVTRHRLREGTGALQAEQATAIARLKRSLAR